MASPRVLGVIPARAGSKRVPGKNLRQLCGKPLIAYTIEAAAKSEKLTDWVVSTECETIAQVAILHGAYVVRRPDDLADDTATSGAVCRHALDWMETEHSHYDMVVLLHPTSPIRDPKHIDEAIERLWASKRHTLASVCQLPTKTHPNIGIINDFDGEWEGSSLLHFILNASIYAMKRNWFVERDLHAVTPCVPFIMDRRHSLDIDEEIDLKIAKLFLAEQASVSARA